MADLAHDASDSASEVTGIALQQASGPASSDKGKLRVFISYSRDDLKFADQLDAALDACGFECLIDRHGISGGEDWKRRLGNLISEADTVVFVLSPSSARSDICAWEVEEADRLNKRILPVICRALEGANPPPRLRDRNYIFFCEEPKVSGSGFGTGLASLVAALNTDFDWLREHTRYLQRAMEWDTGSRPANRLLSGNDIVDAKAWVARRPKGAPEPTALQLDFIRASEEEAEARLSEQRKQLEAMAAAQAERETALHDREEALKQRARVARVRNIALVAVSILALLAVAASALSFWSYRQAQQERTVAEQQKQTAEQRKEQAEDILFGVTKIVAEVRQQMNDDTKKKVFALFQMGANQGDVTSMENLGFLYASGFGVGVTQDYAKAREWFEKAAAKDNLNAMNALGMLFANGLGVPLDYSKAHELFEKAAAKDHADAMYNLGVLFLHGRGVAQDYAKAHEFFGKAAAKDDAPAMNGLGTLYHDGKGVTQDYAKAHEWYEKAAAKDYADAMDNLSKLYFQGHGVPQDYDKAREWAEKAVDKGNTEAMAKLGWLYEHGQGVAQDSAKAREWYEKAAAKDNVGAMVRLGVLYANGFGVPQDYTKAREWYEKAAEKGEVNAKTALEQLSIHEAQATGRYPEALRLQEAFAAKTEADETKRDGKPGEQTAGELTQVIWYALFAKEFTKALTIANRSHTLFPDDLSIESNRVHALLFMGHDEEAKALYLAHKGEVSKLSGKLWEQVIVEDFSELRKAGLTHPMMADIEKELAISR